MFYVMLLVSCFQYSITLGMFSSVPSLVLAS